MSDKETCAHCRHSRGPVVLMCANRQSEFFERPVVAAGYCAGFERKKAAGRLLDGVEHNAFPKASSISGA